MLRSKAQYQSKSIREVSLETYSMASSSADSITIYGFQNLICPRVLVLYTQRLKPVPPTIFDATSHPSLLFVSS